MSNFNKALFLDRDGIINEDRDYVYQIQDFQFKNDIFELCQWANTKGYLIFVITNQAGIARGYYSERDFLKLTKWMLLEFKKHKCDITKVYFSPYHPEFGNVKYRRESKFRKPYPGMILKAAKRFSVDLANSILIGDQSTDIQAGLNAGIGKNLLLLNPQKQKQVIAPEAVVIESLKSAIPFIV